MKLFTDIDLDGLGCGVIAKIAFGEKAYVSYCSYRNLNQRVEHFIDNPDFNDKETYITDLAVNEDVEKKLEKRFNEGHHIQMIDHHVTAMHFNEYKWGMVIPEYDTGKKTCATSLFYDYLIENNKIQGSKALEEFVDLVRQFDTWEWDANDNVTAKRLNDLFYILDKRQFEEEILKRLQENPESFSLTETENLLLDVEDQKIKRYIFSKNRQIVQTTTDDYCIGIVHAEQYLSELGNELHKLNPHLDMIVMLNTGGKKVGFRTIHDHVDVSEFASRFGGGGHPKASGCELSQTLFEKFVVNVFQLSPIKPDPDRNELNVKGASYGTCYENSRGEISYILPLSNENYEVIQNNKKLEQTFDSYESAENYIKRQSNSWLRFDNDSLLQLSTSLSIPVEKVKKNYGKIIKDVIEAI
ncbi:DHH family phosphoesterase [Bacillus sp. 1NLA3E]|uniref:DHH family phosphoesterase n=1 Tax=Bacillus sp. 1NLA3E TaxID=666686 RepID=UPI00032801D2|nr:hypothetical protein [Bacillus sp. 1NLA3E]AGK53965.1 hypothetical protein B1NLA3E_11055 [Bacillus sp. 1NLA3E]